MNNSSILSSFFFFMFLAVGVVVAEDSDLKTFHGDWTVAVAIIDGNEVPADFNKTIQLEMRGNRYKTSQMGVVVDEGTFSLMPDVNPAKLDLTGVKGQNAGKKFRGIYKLEGKDKLTVCYQLDGKAYPEKFDGKASGMVLITYSRKKP